MTSGRRSQWRWDQVLLFPSTFMRQLSVCNTWESLSKFGHKKQGSSWFMNPTWNLYPWLVFTVTIKLVYSVMARPSILSTRVLAEQVMHWRKNNMRTQCIPYPNLEIISSFTSVLTMVLVPFIQIYSNPNFQISRQHVQKKPTLPDRKEDSRNILCVF